MSTIDRIKSSDSFWTRQLAFYLLEHRHPGNRATHMIGIPIIVITPVVALFLWSWKILVLGQVIGWILQLVGHRIEGNRPAFFKQPISFLMGPLMVLIEMIGLLGIRPTFALRAHDLVHGEPAAVP